MSVSVSMPQLGESVTEGTVTRWLKKEGERVEVDEPLLEVSTDKVDTEIPSPASGILRGIAVDEDETVAVGAQLAVIDDGESGDAAPPAADSALAEAAVSAPPGASQPAPSQPERAPASSGGWASPNYAPPASPPAPRPSTPAYAPPPAYGQPQPAAPYVAPAPAYGQPARAAEPAPASQVPAQAQPSPAETAPS